MNAENVLRTRYVMMENISVENDDLRPRNIFKFNVQERTGMLGSHPGGIPGIRAIAFDI